MCSCIPPDPRAEPVNICGRKEAIYHKNKRIKKADELNDTLLTIIQITYFCSFTRDFPSRYNVPFRNSKPHTSLSNHSHLPFQLTSIIPFLNSMCISSVTFLSLNHFIRMWISWLIISNILAFTLNSLMPLVLVLTLSRIQTWINPTICHRWGG